VLGGAPAVLADVGIDDEVVVSLEVVPVVPDESVVVVLVVSVVVVASLSCAHAASVREATVIAAAMLMLRSVLFIGVLVYVPWSANPAGPEEPAG